MKINVGEVWKFNSHVASKQKYHLCLSIDGYFIFLNSPKSKSYLGDFEIDCAEITGLKPTPEGKSIASCSLVMTFSKSEIAKMNGQRIGSVSNKVLKELLIFVENLTTIEEETRDKIVDALGEYVGV